MDRGNLALVVIGTLSKVDFPRSRGYERRIGNIETQYGTFDIALRVLSI